MRFSARRADRFEVVERLPGSATTDFGAPGEVPESDSRPLTRAEARRQAEVVAASWRVFDRIVASAPAELRKGPRGGGRDRDKIVEHVIEAEISYVRTLGLRGRRPSPTDAAAVATLREQLIDLLRQPSDGAPLVERGWPVRYATRRIAWHVLDHAWEIVDRSEPA